VLMRGVLDHATRTESSGPLLDPCLDLALPETQGKRVAPTAAPASHARSASEQSYDTTALAALVRASGPPYRFVVNGLTKWVLPVGSQEATASNSTDSRVESRGFVPKVALRIWLTHN